MQAMTSLLSQLSQTPSADVFKVMDAVFDAELASLEKAACQSFELLPQGCWVNFVIDEAGSMNPVDFATNNGLKDSDEAAAVCVHLLRWLFAPIPGCKLPPRC